MLDKVVVELKKRNVYLNEFQQFPKLVNGANGINFKHYSAHSSGTDVTKSRHEYYALRLAQAEERIFSHPDKYMRAKMHYSDTEKASKIVVHNVDSVLGASDLIWVLGLLTLREDGAYYIEDGTYAVKVQFSSLESVQDDVFFTETCAVLAQGRMAGDTFKLSQLMHPPMLRNKKERYQLNEQDYFGSYVKMTEQLQAKAELPEPPQLDD